MSYQVKSELYSQMRYGHSKHQEKIEQKTHNPDGIFSKSTMNTYIKHCTAFANWAKKTYKCKTLDEALSHVKDYIEMRREKGLSAWTLKLDAAAISKMYGVTSADMGVKTPSRKRADIVRSRSPCAHDKHFSEKKNQKVVDFCKGTGLRRHELKALRPEDVYRRDGKLWVHVEQGKGGKPRDLEVRAGYENHVWACAHEAKGKSTVFEEKQIKNRMDEHGYRAEYAKGIYEQYARPMTELKKNEKYICRNDKKGQIYDKAAMLIASRYLGHNRINVIASNYLY